MKYSELIDLGFERYEMSDGCDGLGFYDFYLFLNVNKKITFEWNWQNPNFVKMVRYEKHNVQNYIRIIDLKLLQSLIFLYTKTEGNNGIKPEI